MFYRVASNHCLLINLSKSKILNFDPKLRRDKFAAEFSVVVNDQIIKINERARSLRVILDRSLKFEKRVNNLIWWAFLFLKLIYGVRHFNLQKIQILFCETLVLSIFNYSYSVYGPNLSNY